MERKESVGLGSAGAAIERSVTRWGGGLFMLPDGWSLDLAEGTEIEELEDVEQLEAHPESGSYPPELRRSSRRYRQIVEPLCRVFYRYDRHSRKLYVLYVMRGEMRFRKSRLFKRERERQIA